MMITESHSSKFYAAHLVLIVAVVCNIALWLVTHRDQPRWPNVPPAPGEGAASALGLGDTQFAYRTLSLPLQIMGNESGLSTPLYLYDYNRLGRWFDILDELDPVSSYVPYIAGYYFGSTQKPKEQLSPVVDYLARVGVRREIGKWHFLVHAIYLAQHRMEDVPRALDLARTLAELPQDMPYWTRQMPAIVSAASGDKDAAVKIMRATLAATLAESKKAGVAPDPVEVGFMIEFICTRMQTAEKAARDPICTQSD